MSVSLFRAAFFRYRKKRHCANDTALLILNWRLDIFIIFQGFLHIFMVFLSKDISHFHGFLRISMVLIGVFSFSWVFRIRGETGIRGKKEDNRKDAESRKQRNRSAVYLSVLFSSFFLLSKREGRPRKSTINRELGRNFSLFFFLFFFFFFAFVFSFFISRVFRIRGKRNLRRKKEDNRKDAESRRQRDRSSIYSSVISPSFFLSRREGQERKSTIVSERRRNFSLFLFFVFVFFHVVGFLHWTEKRCKMKKGR